MPKQTGFQKRQPCKHEPDWSTVTPAQGADEIMDISCKKCGASGSFPVDVEDIQW
jgi:hypothetical protein